MNDAIIVLNAGSSSLKFSIYSVAGEALNLEVRGQVEGLGTKARFTAKEPTGVVVADMDLVESDGKPAGHREAFAHLAKWARDGYRQSLSPIAIGHRMVHGGMDYIEPTIITDKVMAKLESLIPLVPLHQPHNIAGVKAVTHLRPDLPQVACFDTAFHRGRAEVTERLGLPDELFQSGVRRWGFHGLSYQFITAQFRKIAPDIAKGRAIIAHLGSGASMCAVKDGKSVDTTMSFSALDGLPMGTRCGTLDPGVLLYLLDKHSSKEIESLLYKKCGLLGISGISNDVRALLESDSPKAAAAIEYFVYRAQREIGSLTAALGGLDALIFTAGIGENSPVIRRRICAGLAWLGIEIDAKSNEKPNGRISPASRTPSVWVIPTDEEMVIATGTLRAIRSGGKSKQV
jgi:acetate kinase